MQEPDFFPGSSASDFNVQRQGEFDQRGVP
jgi:hypothetical protein